ncbi:MAG: GTP 3',8-cyclase MoaA [Gammaproteobacteria bacterium]|nr:MAG: GTP 3',8-cyclase MoaA [Gammaproteobacteria bacterium]
MSEQGLSDRFGRRINYLRVSVTDRCDLRCIYCMAEKMTFLPRESLLSLEEIARICRVFVELGVTKIRFTGGEPLVRRGVLKLFREVGRLPGLGEMVMTTNGTRLDQYAPHLKEAGMRRLNISLDTLRADRFRRISRVGELDRVLAGIEAAREAGFARIKLNSVILAGRNEDEVLSLTRFAVERGLDISFIEEMPLGEIEERDRAESYYSSDAIRADLEREFTLLPSTDSTGGPSRYYTLAGTGTRVGFISPHSHNFCHLCNRVRLTVEGRLLLCLGHEHSVDLRRVVREHPREDEPLRQAIIDSMAIKPERHEFDLGTRPVLRRHMNHTGG